MNSGQAISQMVINVEQVMQISPGISTASVTITKFIYWSMIPHIFIILHVQIIIEFRAIKLLFLLEIVIENVEPFVSGISRGNHAIEDVVSGSKSTQ